MDLDQNVLEQVMAWGRALDGFKAEYAINALIIVQGYVKGVPDDSGQFIVGIAPDDREKFGLFTMDLAWTFWLDEIFDAAQERGRSLVDVEAIIRAMDGEATTVASTGFVHLRSRFAPYKQDQRAYRLWVDTAESAVRSWHLEDLVSLGTLDLSYAEYIENGYNSTAVPHILATASLLYGFDMPARLGEDAVRSLIRHLSISCRLHNDLFSIEKEREEGSRSNAALLMERFMSQSQARAFVTEELKGYERMLEADATRLGMNDPFARLARLMPEAHRLLYTNPTGRYQEASRRAGTQ